MAADEHPQTSPSTTEPIDEPLSFLAGGNNALPAGTHVGEFEIAGLIGEGGFGIVYRAYDHSLQRIVALKEYMPSALSAHSAASHVTVKSPQHVEPFQAGLRSFVNEARLLAQFDHPALVKVYRFWEDNGTAYMVMPFYRGITLKEHLRARATPPDETWLKNFLAPLLDALELIHHEQCYHRDIAPDNILLLEDGRPLLLDFGAARRAIAGKVNTFTVILKHGYAPIEQYAETSSMAQGPWTDIYALACVVYLAITGHQPVPAVARMDEDPHVRLEQKAAGKYSPEFLRAIDYALSVKPENRPQSIADLRSLLGLTSGNTNQGRRGKPSEPRQRTQNRLIYAAIAAISTIAAVTAFTAAVLPHKDDRASAASLHTPKDAAFDPVRALDDVFQARNRDHAVTISIDQAQVRIGVDQLMFSIRSSKPGYVYLLMVGTDRSQFWLLFPNSLDNNNRIEADQQLDLPRARWRMVASGPPGTNQFVAIVSDSPRDFQSAGLKKLEPFSEFPLATAAQLQRAASGAAPLFAGKAKCQSGQGACSEAYGAAVFSIAEIAK